MSTRAQIEIYRSFLLSIPSQRWRWRLRAINGKVIAEGGEGYHSKHYARSMAHRIVEGSYAGADIVDMTERQR